MIKTASPTAITMSRVQTFSSRPKEESGCCSIGEERFGGFRLLPSSIRYFLYIMAASPRQSQLTACRSPAASPADELRFACLQIFISAARLFLDANSRCDERLNAALSAQKTPTRFHPISSLPERSKHPQPCPKTKFLLLRASAWPRVDSPVLLATRDAAWR